MHSRSGRQATSPPRAKDQPAGPPENLDFTDPLPPADPPRANKRLLLISAVLLLSWMLFLIWMAMFN